MFESRCRDLNGRAVTSFLRLILEFTSVYKPYTATTHTIFRRNHIEFELRNSQIKENLDDVSDFFIQVNKLNKEKSGLEISDRSNSENSI